MINNMFLNYTDKGNILFQMKKQFVSQGETVCFKVWNLIRKQKVERWGI